MSPSPTPAESELLRRMWAGDEAAFTTLYRRHQSPVYRYAYQMTGRQQIAEEVTQEVFLLIMRSRGQYDPEKAPFAAYLYGIARRFIFRALKREGLYTTLDDPTADPSQLSSAGPDPLAELTRHEQLNHLREAILRLPEPFREVVVLCELHELDYAQAASVIGCPLGTVRSRLHRARLLLATKLKGLEKCPA